MRRRTSSLCPALLLLVVHGLGCLPGPGPDGGTLDGGDPEADGGPVHDDAGVPSIGLTAYVMARPHDEATWAPITGPVRYSDPLRFVAEGLTPGDLVTLRFEANEAIAWGVFEVDGDGEVDTSEDAPVGGTWLEADVDGPLWSAALPETPPPGLDLSVLAFLESPEGEVLDEVTVERDYVNTGVFTMSVDDGEVVGTLALPAETGDGGPYPAVMVFGGSEGGRSFADFYAPYLAQLGFAALGVAYFGVPGMEQGLTDIPLERLEEGLAYLTRHPEVDPDRIAVLGGSRGGELALLLGSRFPDVVAAVIADVPSGVVWGSATVDDAGAWTYGGAELPWLSFSPDATFDVSYEGGIPWFSSSGAYHTTLDWLRDNDPDRLAAATIPVENIDGPVLMLGGADDQLWPSCDLAQIAWDRLMAAGHAATFPADAFHCLEGAGHGISTPGQPTSWSTGYFDPATQGYIDLGGTPGDNARAGRRANTLKRAFLEEVLAP
jgi:pimeloyl-ACP methyl ester carboxylesterase